MGKDTDLLAVLWIEETRIGEEEEGKKEKQVEKRRRLRKGKDVDIHTRRFVGGEE